MQGVIPECRMFSDNGNMVPPTQRLDGHWVGNRGASPDTGVIATTFTHDEAKALTSPEYEDDDSVYAYPDFNSLGFEYGHVKCGTFPDNVRVTGAVLPDGVQ